jgi:hypothetical protein
MIELEGTVDDFASLSLKDLLEARDLYHFHLMNKANVVGTAVGRYLIRRQGVAHSEPRTFANSEVRDMSWPCVLVVVSDWVERKRFRGDGSDKSPYDIVPKALFMPDGRKVPVCLVHAEPAQPPPPAVPSWVFRRATSDRAFPW